jgi:hypothetical protein
MDAFDIRLDRLCHDPMARLAHRPEQSSWANLAQLAD